MSRSRFADPADFRRSDSDHRVAFTLLELLLTLAIFAAVSAVVLPRLDWLVADSRLDRAAKQLMIEMTLARVDAMREGQVRMMEISPETGDFRVRPFASLTDATESSAVTPGTSALLSGADQAMFVPLQSTEGKTKDLQLPETVLFGSVSVLSSARSSQVATSALQNPVAEEMEAAVATPVLFYPDGTTSTAAIHVKHAESGSRIVKLRGITGDVTISDGGILDSAGGGE